MQNACTQCCRIFADNAPATGERRDQQHRWGGGAGVLSTVWYGSNPSCDLAGGEQGPPCNEGPQVKCCGGDCAESSGSGVGAGEDAPESEEGKAALALAFDGVAEEEENCVYAIESEEGEAGGCSRIIIVVACRCSRGSILPFLFEGRDQSDGEVFAL